MPGSPDEDMSLYGKTAAGKYRIVSVGDTGNLLPADGQKTLLGATVQLWSEDIQPDGTWKANDSLYDLTSSEAVRGTYNSKSVLTFPVVTAYAATAAAQLFDMPATIALVANWVEITETSYLFDTNLVGGRYSLSKPSSYNDYSLLGQAWLRSGPDAPGGIDTFICVLETTPGLSRLKYSLADVSGDTGTRTSYGFGTLGNHYQARTDANMGGWIGDFFLWNRRLNSREIDDVESTLKARWGIV